MSYAEMSLDEKIAKSEEKQRKAHAYQLQLRRVATAEAEVPGVYLSGQTSKKKLAETYDVSTMTITRILTANGIATHALHRLTSENKKEVVQLLAQGETPEVVAAAYEVSVSTVRKLGISEGVIAKGTRKPHRSDAEYEVIKALDDDIRARFGAGLYLLGTGLRAWEARIKKQNEPTPAESATQAEPTAETAAPQQWPEVSDPQPGYPVEPEVAAAAPDSGSVEERGFSF